MEGRGTDQLKSACMALERLFLEVSYALLHIAEEAEIGASHGWHDLNDIYMIC
jgi:hypothetical protein